MSPTIFPAEIAEGSAMAYFPKIKVKSQVIYITVLLCTLISLCSTAFIYIDITVHSPGIIRPVAEKSEIRTLAAGIIDSIAVREGDKVKLGQPLIYLQTHIIDSKLQLIAFQQEEKEMVIRDLHHLCRYPENFSQLRNLLQSPVFRKQYNEFESLLRDNYISRTKLLRDFNVKKKLYDDGKIISLQELEDKRFELSKIMAALRTTIDQQLSKWQSELYAAKISMQQLRGEEQQLKAEKSYANITATVDGTVQQFNGKYKAAYVQPGELMGVISPDSTFVALCFVSPADIGLIKKGMEVNFRIDAFNYNSWGILKGNVYEVGNDFTTINNKPVFMVKCFLQKTILVLKTGYKGEIKKGMTLQAGFIIAKRSIWQLMSDNINDWLNPHGNTTEV